MQRRWCVVKVTLCETQRSRRSFLPFFVPSVIHFLFPAQRIVARCVSLFSLPLLCNHWIVLVQMHNTLSDWTHVFSSELVRRLLQSLLICLPLRCTYWSSYLANARKFTEQDAGSRKSLLRYSVMCLKCNNTCAIWRWFRRKIRYKKYRKFDS